MSLESQAADVGLPRAYDATKGVTGVVSRATSPGGQRYVMPTTWLGKIVEFYAKGFEIQVLFGDAAVAATVDADSAIAGTTTQTLLPAAATAWPISAGAEKPVRVPNDPTITHFSVISTGVGRFFARVAENAG